MFRQLLIALVIVGAAAAAYVFLVPGAPETLARFGINLPVAEPVEAAADPAAQARSAGNGGQRQQNAQGGEAPARQGAANGQRGQGGGGFGGFGGRGGNRAMVVVTSPVMTATINDKLTAIGEGSAANSVTVVSPATGTLKELAVQPGATVAAGDVIARLDSDAEQIAFERAKLTFDDAQAAAERTKELVRANSATNVQVSTAKLALDTARLEMQNAELDLKKRTITTPFAGTVGLFQITAGNSVTSQTVVTTIEDTSHILISFWVPERYASSVKVGMPVTAAAVALPGVEISGEVSAVDNRIDPASRTLKVQAQIPNENGQLKPGMSFSVSMTFPGEQFPSVDPLAIQWSSEGSYLWKYADKKVEKLPVQIIQRNSDGVLVKAELKQGDQVVTQGVQQLTAGATVRLLDELADAGGNRDQNRQGGNGAPGQNQPQGQSQL